MKTIIGLILILAYSFVCPLAGADQPRPVRRSNTVSVTMRFNSEIQSGTVLLTWQTYDDTAIRQNRDHGMALVFECSGNVDRAADVVTVPCTVPSDVADGNYYLVAASLRNSENQRTYSWQGELPADLVLSVKGGATVVLPNMRSIQISESNH
jgi:hypothetical protein